MALHGPQFVLLQFLILLLAERAVGLVVSPKFWVRKRTVMEPLSVVCKIGVCKKESCKRNGGGQRLVAIFHDVIDRGDEEFATVDWKIVDVPCQDSCQKGPNVVLRSEKQQSGGTVCNYVNDEECVKSVLRRAISDKIP